MKGIIQEVKRVVKQAGLVTNNKRLRSLYNPQAFELAIEASQKTGDVKWITMILEKSFARQNMGEICIAE